MTGFMSNEGRKKDFYEKNIGEAVNLYTEKSTLSGDISKYDRGLGVVTLKNYISLVYDEKGEKTYVEKKEEVEVETRIILSKEPTTKENRLGRIVDYNKTLELERLEQERRLHEIRNLQNQPS